MGSALGSRFRVIIPPLVLTLALLVAWQLYCTLANVPSLVLPSPLRVLEQGWANRESIWQNTVPTLQETLMGFAVSLVIAWLLATAIHFWKPVKSAVYPLLIVSQTIPIMAIAPLLVIWFGFGLFPKIVVVVLVTFFPITVALVQGFASADADSERLLRSMGAKRLQRFFALEVPQALPSFFTGLRISITFAVIAAIFAEYVGATHGLGIYMLMQKNAARTDLVLAAVVVTAIVSLLLFALTLVVERLVLPWESVNKNRKSR
jgi:ABC-type nitrate/sulfonate/bicarbonate transport system permease component